jgi:C1A family cysteine protease
VSRWILTVGPCVLGIDWLNSMFDTDLYKRSTFIRWNPTSGIAGGHAICAHEVDIHKLCPDGTHGAVGIQNSWGAEWGNNGRAWLSFTALAALLAEDGEASMANEIVRPVAKAA